MASHRNPEANPLVGIAVAIALLTSVILYAALLVLKVALTVGLYVLPFVAIYAPLFIRTISQNPPELPSTEAFEDLDEEEEVIRLLTTKYEEEISIEEQYEIGKGSNILLTKATNQTRFDTRSKKGRALNQDIDESKKIIASVMEEVKNIRRNIYRSIPEWSKDYREWIDNRSLYYASRQGIWFFSISAVTLYFISLIYYKNIQEFINGTGGILLWKPGENVLLEPLSVSAAISYVVFGVIWKL